MLMVLLLSVLKCTFYLYVIEDYNEYNAAYA